VLVCAQLMAVLATALAAAGVLRRQGEHWVRPTEDLVRILAEVRAGRAPIEEVRAIGGGVAPLVPILVELLHDRRRQEQANATLQAEMRQRVASRTDALERSLATVKSQAQHDLLSGLFNRRALDEAFPRVIHQCRAAGADLHVLMIDMDRFKQVNDQLGHAAGDALIADVGDLIRSSIRQGDLAFRFGGDEFTILVPGGDRAAAQALADRLTRLGAQLGRTLRIQPQPGLSVGMTSLSANPSDATMADLLKAADATLYANKATRRRSA
jgi:diguanylate cyclase (GGDEF)-like protein